MVSCTDLGVKETDSFVITTESGEFLGVDAAGTLSSAYNEMNWQNTQENLYALNEATTDEQFIPTRGTDWGDNGVWRDLARHAWTGAHTFNYKAWNYLNANVYRANQILHPKTTKTAQQEAEAKFIRAYNMFWILDLWRQIPFREADQGPAVLPSVKSGQEAFDFIVADLTSALPNLPATAVGNIGAQNKASKASANYLLAKLYLNKHIYLGGDAQSADMDKVIGYVTAIEADGYKLQDGFFGIFGPSGDNETIFWANGQYEPRIWGSLHYNQGRETYNTGGGWNGFATTADFYAKFEGPADNNAPGAGQEERRGFVPANSLGVGFLVGTQGGPDGVVKARSGSPLVFTKDVPALTGQPDYTGVRLLKWHPGVKLNRGKDNEKDSATINMAGQGLNHLVLMRYADALLMKAEALFRKGDAGQGLILVNQLRVIRKATPLASLTADVVLDERARELYLEGWRRNDMVRFGKFNAKFAFVDNTDASRNIFPIPDNALGSNPNLKPTDGY